MNIAPPAAIVPDHAIATLPTLLFGPDHRTTIRFARVDECDFGIRAGGGLLDLHIRKELMRRKSLVENDQELSPQGIESITLDGIDHGNEILFLVQIV